MKGFKLWPLLGTHGHGAVRIHNRVTPTVIRIRYIRLYGHPRGLATLTHHAERLAGELSLPVLKTLVCRIPESNPNFPHARQTLHQLSHCGVFFKKEKTFLYLTSVATLNELCTSLYNIISTSDISIWVKLWLNQCYLFGAPFSFPISIYRDLKSLRVDSPCDKIISNSDWFFVFFINGAPRPSLSNVIL